MKAKKPKPAPATESRPAWRPNKYTPLTLELKFDDYLEHIKNFPILEKKVFGTGFETDVAKMTAMSVEDFCDFAEIVPQTFYNYCKEDQFLDITTRIRNKIYAHNFRGAAADMLNANLIARQLGLADKQKVEIQKVGKELADEQYTND